MASDREQTQRRRRALHEQLRALSYEPLMRGSLVERSRKCGRPTCACARDASALHKGKFLTVSLDGRTRGLHVRPDDEGRIRAALTAYDKLWKIINGLTECELADLRRQARERGRGRARQRAK
jgi:hypothetical protein